MRRGVGFRLPQGAVSDAYNLAVPGTRINTSIDPWGDGTAIPTPASLAARYGEAAQTQPGTYLLPDVQGMHVTDNQSDLEDMRRLNPAWFGPDWQEFDGVPTETEIHDAHYTQVAGLGAQLHRDVVRLRQQEGGGGGGRETPVVTADEAFRKLMAMPEWQQMNYWEMPGSEGRQQDLFRAAVEIARRDPQRDLPSLHGPARFQPSLVIEVYDKAHAGPLPATATAAPPAVPSGAVATYLWQKLGQPATNEQADAIINAALAAVASPGGLTPDAVRALCGKLVDTLKGIVEGEIRDSKENSFVQAIEQGIIERSWPDVKAKSLAWLATQLAG